jgi:hypothetical protein
MTTADETPIGEERCLRLERHKIRISVDLRAGDTHTRIYGDADELLSHLAATPKRARSIGIKFLNAADRADPAGATLLVVDLAKYSAGQRAELRELLARLEPAPVEELKK